MRCGSPTCLTVLNTLRQPQSSRTIALAGGASLGITCGAAAAGVCPGQGEAKRGTCAGGCGGCGHVPQLCFLPVWALLSCSHGASFQIQGLLDISSLSPEPRPSPAWQRAGNTQAQGLKGSQEETWPRRVAGQGMRVAAHRGPAAALEGEQGCLGSHGDAAWPGTQRCYRQQLWGCRKPGE